MREGWGLNASPIITLAKIGHLDLLVRVAPEYKDLAAQWHDWNAVIAVCTHVAVVVFDYICEQNDSVQE